MSRHPVILVVDDDADIRNLCRMILDERFEVLEAADGEEAIRLLDVADPRPDLALLDIMLPGTSGWGVVAHIRNRPELADIAIVLLTSRGEEDFVQRAREMDIAYVGKPFRERELLNTILSSLAGRGSNPWG